MWLKLGLVLRLNLDLDRGSVLELILLPVLGVVGKLIGPGLLGVGTRVGWCRGLVVERLVPLALTL